jgi:serine/threonine protein kinase
MVTGRCPFIGSNIAQVLRQIMDDNPVPDVRDIAPDVPSEVAVLIRRMCVKDRSRRLQNFDTVLMELEKLPYDLRGCRSSGSLYNPRGGSLGHVPAVPQV